MQVMFEGSNGKIRQIGSFESDGLSDHEAHDKAYKIIKAFCDDHNFKIYYTRLWSVVDKDGVSKTIDARHGRQQRPRPNPILADTHPERHLIGDVRRRSLAWMFHRIKPPERTRA